MILVNVVMLHSAVISCCRLSCVTETTPEHTDSFSTRAFQATDTIPNAKFMNFGSKIAQSCDQTFVHPKSCVYRLRQILYCFLMSLYTRLLFDS